MGMLGLSVFNNHLIGEKNYNNSIVHHVFIFESKGGKMLMWRGVDLKMNTKKNMCLKEIGLRVQTFIDITKRGGGGEQTTTYMTT